MVYIREMGISYKNLTTDHRLVSKLKELVKASYRLRVYGLSGLSSEKEEVIVEFGDLKASSKEVKEKFSIAPNYEYMTDEEIELASKDELFADHVIGHSSIFSETVTDIRNKITRSLQKSAEIIAFEIAALPSKLKSLISVLPLVVDILDNHDIPTFLSPRITPSPITACA